MIVERAVDCGALYEQQRRHLLTLARGLTDEELRTPVPATPAWSVLDVVSHLVGIAADLNAGWFGRGDADEWTAEQVATRRGRPLDDVATEWDTEVPTFEDGLRLFGYETGSHFVGDLVQHIADVNHALTRPWASGDEAIVVALDFYLDSFHETLLEHAVGTVQLEMDGDQWLLGSGAVVAHLTVGRFELLRALGGRRSEAQLRAMDWDGELERVVPLVSRYGLPAADLVEH